MCITPRVSSLISLNNDLCIGSTTFMERSNELLTEILFDIGQEMTIVSEKKVKEGLKMPLSVRKPSLAARSSNLYVSCNLFSSQEFIFSIKFAKPRISMKMINLFSCF